MDRKSVLISGGSGETGRAAALKFLREGWQVVLADENAAKLKADLGDNAEDIVFLGFDPSEGEKGAERLFGEMDALGITADALVTAHRMTGVITSAEKYDIDEWNAVLRYNVIGAVMLTRQFAKRLVRKNTGGTVTFVGSVCAKTAVPGMCAFTASMGAIRSLAKGLALDLGQYGIRVNCVMPGMESELPVPLGKSSGPEEIADIVYFFSTPASGSTTGSELVTDGGTDCLVPGAY